MRRFLIILSLLILTLLIARRVEAASFTATWSSESDSEFSTGPTTERAAFFDHSWRSLQRRSRFRSAYSRSIDAPRSTVHGVQFRYRDRNYEQVWVSGDFDGWVRHRMDYDDAAERWQTELEVKPGRHRYVFIVVDEGDDERERTDPANPRRRRHVDHGWVSEIIVERDGDVRFDRPRSRSRSRRDDFDFSLEGTGVEYQRVDGLVLHAGPTFRSTEPWAPGIDSWFGYGFSSEEWSARVSFLQPLLPDRRLRIHFSAYDRTDTVDRTGVGDFENSLSTLVFREDNRDWFRREGLSIGLEAEFGDHFLGRAELRSDTYSSQPRRVIAGWGGREDFLPNPDIDEGLMRSLFVRGRLGTDLNHFWLEFETADAGFLPTEFEFTQLTAQYRSRLRLGRGAHIDLRLRAGTTLSGDLPRQKRYLAGGIGTVRGYRYQSLLVGDAVGEGAYGGEKILLANAEYVLGDDSGIGFAFFADAGQVFQDSDDDFDLDALVSSVGVGVLLEPSFGEEGLRFDLIKSLEGDGGMMLQARLRRPF